MGVVSEHSVVVEWRHCDPAGIAFCRHYFTWFHSATQYLFRAAGLPLDRVEERFGISLPVMEVSGRFLLPVRAGQTVIFRSVSDVRDGHRLIIRHEAYCGGELVAAGKEVRACLPAGASADEAGGRLPVPDAVL